MIYSDIGACCISLLFGLFAASRVRQIEGSRMEKVVEQLATFVHHHCGQGCAGQVHAPLELVHVVEEGVDGLARLALEVNDCGAIKARVGEDCGRAEAGITVTDEEE